ncbi:MAG: hypothetical protein QOG53_3141 [Frankiales bacterium]|jgi:hypothetical protein|nr:hypothetical protein [Frankiales bacterium]
MTGSSAGGSTSGPEPAAFISHSSHDKRLFVRPLVECIADQGVDVWYDEYSMRPGDSLSASIDRGLATAHQGVVVISPAFIETAKQSGWTHYELRGIVSNSIGGSHRRIVPVWLDVTADDVREWSPPLADLLAIDASTKPIEAVALEIVQVIAPSKAGGLQRQRFMQMMRQKGRSAQARLHDLNAAPIVERRTPGSVPLRALLVTQILADCGAEHASDFVGFLEDLARDLHHETELRLWEAIAGSYSLACSTYDLDSAQRLALYKTLVLASFGQADEEAVEVLTPDVAGPVLEHFQTLMSMVRGEAVIGEGGLRGLLMPVEPSDDEAASPAAGDIS